MHILCTICSDLVNQAESLYVTKCGHIFHHQCLAQWIERSKSCPQCRNKVTDKCMFRMYPTVSNENSGEDAATLQSRLDDAMLQLRTQHTRFKELEDQLTTATADLNKKEELLKASEKRLVSRESAVAALREQLDYVREQNKETNRLREENDQLHKNMQTLNGLQKVLNATADEVEAMLRDYSDLRTVATFAAALKRALCESESKKREWRARQLGAAREHAAQRARSDQLHARLGQLQEKMSSMERKYEALKHKRKASADAERAAKQPRGASPPVPPAPPAPASPPAHASPPARPADSFSEQTPNDAVVSEENLSFGSLVTRIESSESPYLPLRRSGLALVALQQRARSPPHRAVKPSEFAILQSARRQTSMFKMAPAREVGAAQPDASYDGLGGHSKPDRFPSPPARPPLPPLPRPGAKHRLKKFNTAPAGSQDIAKMFGKLQDH